MRTHNLPRSIGIHAQSHEAPHRIPERNSNGNRTHCRTALSTTFLLIELVIAPGSLTAEITVPTTPDDETEPTEHLRLHLLKFPAGTDQEVLGTVTDQP